MDAEKNCPICAKPLPISKTRPIVYCSEACKQKAKRRREKDLRQTTKEQR